MTDKETIKHLKQERDSALAREQVALADAARLREALTQISESHEGCVISRSSYSSHCTSCCIASGALSAPSSDWLAGVKADEYQRGREQGMVDASCIVDAWHIKNGGYSELAHIIREKARGEKA